MEVITEHIGRKKGTPNKRTTELIERLESMDCDPLAALVKIAGDPKTPLETRVSINRDLLAYIFPKRKAVEVAHDQQPIILRFSETDMLL